MKTKKALVTGGSSGIGRAIVKRLASDGFQVSFTWHSDSSATQSLAEDLSACGNSGYAFQANLSSVEGIQRLVSDVKAESFDVLVNNAMSVTEIAPITETQLTTWQENLTIGVTAPFLLIKHLSPAMPTGSSIINISSLNTAMPQPGIAGYCAAKSALESLTQVAAKELASQGITVNALRPGPTDTPGNRAVNPDPAIREQIATMIPLGRYGQPEDVAGVASFLASKDARWMTGQVISVTGGL
ncbi:3-oxoacyl-[acyl-carrier-protein] reductase FabG [Corynebacterium kalinowskii]|uniref:3-oxoacyl-[acyl-carrier-protein] reductase FabG n=1 Tax=Corynebacterium kalinowskii TaxID=2675216 RepID=A0A6B8VAY6_9CORY|nr:SDR family oxidoreductase [Corynebacterium kalinowskii]QGU02302.1 3-oxoacyl-[acyl-carrier-protein] reductase FabG [Corynebacterium kalinowskii]